MQQKFLENLGGGGEKKMGKFQNVYVRTLIHSTSLNIKYTDNWCHIYLSL